MVFIRRPKLLLPVLLAFVLLAPFIRFEVNDDIQMLTAASGSATGGAGMPQLMFVSSVLGRLLVLLYAWTRNVEWYGILMAGFALAASFALGRVFLAATRDSVRAQTIAVAGTIAVLTGTLLTMQYTRIGILLAIAGTLLVLSDPTKIFTRQTDGRWAVLWGAVLILLAFMCRFEAAALGLLLAMPAAILLLRQREAWRGAFKRTVMGALVAGPLVLGHAWLDQRAYAVPEWTEGFRYFYAVRPFADYHLHRKVCNEEECAKRSAAWTVNDFQMLDDFIYADPVVYSKSNLIAVGDRLFPQGTSATWRLSTRLRPLARLLHIDGNELAAPAAVSRKVDRAGPDLAPSPTNGKEIGELDSSQAAAAILVRIFEGALAHHEFALFCFMLAFALQLANRNQRFAILGYAGWVGLLLAVLYLFTKSPPHWVIRPFWLGAAAVLLIAGLRSFPVAAPHLDVRRLVLVVLMGLSLYVVVTSVRGIRVAVKYEQLRDEYLAKRPPNDAILVTSLASFPFESLWRPFGGNAEMHAQRWLLLGWMTGTPAQSAQLRGSGISRPLVAATCSDHAILLGSEYHASLLTTFVREKAGMVCRLSMANSIGESGIWRGKRLD